MSQPYVGEIRLVPFNFAPVGWAFCNGQLLPISQFETLFALIGTTYGGDGQQTFSLPDLQGRVVVGTGQANDGNYVIGEALGVEQVTLTPTQLPQHNHVLNVSGSLGTTPLPSGNHLATSPLALGNVYDPAAGGVMPSAVVGPSGGNLPHDNQQPFLALNYIISLFGIFPTQG